MKHKYIKGSAEDFKGLPDWVTHVSNDQFMPLHYGYMGGKLHYCRHGIAHPCIAPAGSLEEAEIREHGPWKAIREVITGENEMSTTKKEMQAQMEKLLAEVNTLKQQIESMPDEKVIWEPKGGEWYVTHSATVINVDYEDKCRNFGVEYQTRELAEQALVAMRIHNRLLAYKAEFCPDYEPDWNDSNAVKYCVYFNTCSEKYGFSSNATYQMLGGVYFPREVVNILIDKLNSGEVVL